MTEPPGLAPSSRPIFRLPRALADRVREVTSGQREVAAPRDAASVLLLRDAASAAAAAPAGAGTASARATSGAPLDQPALEVYMLRRARSMSFAPGASAFPGGSVDPRDADAEVGWAGPAATDWGRLLHAPPELARALVCAAVRETFEESGVLLAGPTASSLVPDTSGEDWEAERQALLDRSLSLAGLLARRRLVLRSDLLRPWARWITPAPEPRRYDTRFFAAALPAGQHTRDVSGEADQVAWVRPADAIRAARDRELRLMPPTAACLGGLLPFGDVAAALHAQRDLAPVTPQMVEVDGELWLALPVDLDYPL